ncbi:Ribonucleases P/MRP protein subunit pop1, partial [Exophiala xenobiotica]
MKEDNTPTVTKRTRTPSRRLRLRLGTAKLIKQLNQKRKTYKDIKIEEEHFGRGSEGDCKVQKETSQQDVAAYASLAHQESTYDTANGALVEDGDTNESDREELPTEPSSSG